MESSSRIDTARKLWEQILATRYLDAALYEKNTETIKPLLKDIRAFLRDEPVRYELKPNVARSLALVIGLLPLSNSGPRCWQALLFE